MKNSSSIRWAFNSASIMHSPWEEELGLWQEFGWDAAEIWYSKLEPQLAKGVSFTELLRQMREAGVDPVGMCATFLCSPTSEKDDPEGLEHPEMMKMLDATAAMDAKSLTVIVDGAVETDLASEYKAIAPKIYRYADLAAERGLKLNLEFLGQSGFNGTLGSCIELVNLVDHPALGMLLDFCHYYVSASHIEEMALMPSEKLFMVHVNGTRPYPMEVIKNEERSFPDEGRMDVAGMINHLYNNVGYKGYYSIELYDQNIWQLEPRSSMQRLADSLKNVEAKLELVESRQPELVA